MGAVAAFSNQHCFDYCRVKVPLMGGFAAHSSKCSVHSYEPDLKSIFAPVWNWPREENHKNVSANEKTIETEMRNGTYAFFPASRREDPDWLNPNSLKARPTSSSLRFNKQLDKPLWVETCAEENISWVLDVFLDSLIDPDKQQKFNNFVSTLQGQQITLPQELLLPANRPAFMRARKNVEQILQTVLQDNSAELILIPRNADPSRISIKMGDGRIIPTLQSLSEGQSQLFHLFATIIRYGERTDLNRSVNLSQITGLVIVDEIAAHLHPTLQHDVLPELISLFPKVQFIVSSHSPLFLLGMEKRFSPDRVTILELDGGGYTGLNNFLKVYAVHPLSFNHAILLLYDWDTHKPSDQIEKLWIRSIPKNSEDAEEKRGIENLFPSALFTDCFYEEKPKKGIHGRSNVIHDFKKQEFCDWICDVRRDPADFAKFNCVVEILREFSQAHQPPPDQQPPSE